MSSWISAEIQEVNTLSDTIVQVLLQPHTYIPYQAGQYLQIKTQNFKNYFSIANAPLGSHHYELHIRHDNNNPSSIELLEAMKKQGQLEIQLPFGRCHLESFSAERNLIFIAGGTGFAPIKAMIEQLLFNQDPRSFSCFWGAKNQNDLYCESLLTDWKKHVKNFQALKLYAGKKSYNMSNDFLNAYGEQLKNLQIILSGPFDMVFEYRNQLLAHGLSKEFIFSDAFEFEQ